MAVHDKRCISTSIHSVDDEINTESSWEITWLRFGCLRNKKPLSDVSRWDEIVWLKSHTFKESNSECGRTYLTTTPPLLFPRISSLPYDKHVSVISKMKVHLIPAVK